jgi:hypothetical protein
MKNFLKYCLAFGIGFVFTFVYSGLSSIVHAYKLTGEKQCSNPVYFRWGGSIAYNHKKGFTAGMKKWHSAQKYRKFVGKDNAKGVLDSYKKKDGYNGYAQWWFSGKCITSWVAKLNNQYTTTYKKSRKVGGHELGHILGLADTSNSKVLMYEYTPNVSKPQPDDLRGIRAIYSK